MKVLTGKQIFGMTIDPNAQSIKTGPNKGQIYFRARHDGAGFTVNQEFFDAFTNGNLYEVSLREGTYKVVDPENADAFIERASWSVSGFATKKQIKSITEFEYELKLIEVKGLPAVTESEVAQLQHAL